MRVLLTGSSGFIGKNLKNAWTGRYDLSAPSHCELDLLDTEAVKTYLKENHFDVVLHTANTNDVIHPELGPRILEYNLQMFCNLERCRDLYGKLFYFGSGAEYDMRHYIPKMRESYFDTYVPRDPYGFSKYIMSKQATGNIYDLRLFGVFGKYEEWQHRFISNMIYQNLTGNLMRMNQNTYFDYLYISDLVPVLEWFFTHEPKHHHYNVCSGQRFELLSLAHMVMEETGISRQITIEQKGLKPEYTGDSNRLQKELGELFLTPMRTAVRELVDYYRENGFH